MQNISSENAEEWQEGYMSDLLRYEFNFLFAKLFEVIRSYLFFHFQVQKQRQKTLSMFGALFPPKLRAAQLSFETGKKWSYFLIFR